jgi:hypothetical protein
MSIYDVDFSQIAVQATPPDKRYRYFVAWLKALVKPVQWLRDLWMGDYRTGTTAVAWISGTTYAKYARVLYKQKVYESLVNGNTNTPTEKATWMVVQQNFIGVFERVLYNGCKLIFEYAINKYFGSVFRQPPGVSDIYITVSPKPYAVFISGGTVGTSSVVFSNNSSQFIINYYIFSPFSNMTIHVPVALFSALDTDPLNSEKIIRNYADQYIIAGILYDVVIY